MPYAHARFNQQHHISSSQLNEIYSGVLNKHFDCAGLCTPCAGLKGGNRILQIKSMGHQSLHINNSALDEANSAGPGIGVAVLELEIDFLGAKTHERDLYVGLSDANDEDFAAEFDRVNLTDAEY